MNTGCHSRGRDIALGGADASGWVKQQKTCLKEVENGNVVSKNYPFFNIFFIKLGISDFHVPFRPSADLVCSADGLWFQEAESVTDRSESLTLAGTCHMRLDCERMCCQHTPGIMWRQPPQNSQIPDIFHPCPPVQAIQDQTMTSTFFSRRVVKDHPLSSLPPS